MGTTQGCPIMAIRPEYIRKWEGNQEVSFLLLIVGGFNGKKNGQEENLSVKRIDGYRDANYLFHHKSVCD